MYWTVITQMCNTRSRVKTVKKREGAKGIREGRGGADTNNYRRWLRKKRWKGSKEEDELKKGEERGRGKENEDIAKED